MEAQVEILRAIVKGDIPATSENLRKAFNRDVLADEVCNDQLHRVQSVIKFGALEQSQLEAEIKKRRAQIEKIETLTRSFGADTSPLQAPAIEKLQTAIRQLANTHLASLDLGTPEEIYQVLWSLVQVTSRNEHIVVPAYLRIVQFLQEEGLIMVDRAGENAVRIRIY